MSKAAEYRQEAAKQRHLVAETASLRDSSRHRKMAIAYEALANSEDWLAGAIAPQAGQ